MVGMVQPIRYEFDKKGGIVYQTFEQEGAESPLELTLDVYQPQGEGTFPALLLVHGGSWHAGTKLNWFRHARKLARKRFCRGGNQLLATLLVFHFHLRFTIARQRFAGYVLMQTSIKSIPNGLAGSAIRQAPIWWPLLATSDSADGLEGVPAKEQAGISSRIQAAALGGAPCDFGWVGDHDRTLVYWLGATRAVRPAVYRQATPATYLTDDDPPCYFFHAGSDRIVAIESAKTFHEQIENLEIESHFEVWEGMGHFGLFSSLDAMDPVIDFFHERLPDPSRAPLSPIAEDKN